MSEMSFSSYIALSDAEQSEYDEHAYRVAPVLDRNAIDAMMGAVALGTAFSLSGVICKIFQFVLRIAKQVIAVVSEITKDLLNATFEILGDALGGLSKSLFSSPLGIAIVAGLGLWAASKLGLFGDDDEEEDDDEQEQGGTVKTAVADYYTYGGYSAVRGQNNV